MLPVHPQPWTPSSPRGNVAAASPLTQALIYPAGRVNNPFSLSVPGKYSKPGLAQRGRDGDPVCEGEEKWPDKGLRDKVSELPPRGRMSSGTHEVQKKWPFVLVILCWCQWEGGVWREWISKKQVMITSQVISQVSKRQTKRTNFKVYSRTKFAQWCV